MATTTTFENKCGVLSELWLVYRDEEGFESFIKYNDIALPLAFAIHEGIVERTEKAQVFIDEAFDLLIRVFLIEDTGYDNLEDVIKAAEVAMNN